MLYSTVYCFRLKENKYSPGHIRKTQLLGECEGIHKIIRIKYKKQQISY
jgi:hypothetical protein